MAYKAIFVLSALNAHIDVTTSFVLTLLSLTSAGIKLELSFFNNLMFLRWNLHTVRNLGTLSFAKIQK